jgi:hypothetical protein
MAGVGGNKMAHDAEKILNLLIDRISSLEEVQSIGISEIERMYGESV